MGTLMTKLFEFDETESLEDVLARYRATCGILGIPDADSLVGEEFLRTFHPAIVTGVRLGNQPRLERTVGSGRIHLQVIGLPSGQRRGLRGWVRRLLGRG